MAGPCSVPRPVAIDQRAVKCSRLRFELWYGSTFGVALGTGTKPMIRRDFIKLIIASLALHPLAATAQRSIPIIGALSPAARPAQFDSTAYDVFLQGMRELGYVEGKDYLIEWRFADGDYARLPELAKELVGLKVKVLVATSTAAIQAAHKVTTAIPIVMVFYEDDRSGTALPQVLDILPETSQDWLLWGRKSSRNLWTSYGLFFQI